MCHMDIEFRYEPVTKDIVVQRFADEISAKVIAGARRGSVGAGLLSLVPAAWPNGMMTIPLPIVYFHTPSTSFI